MALPVDEIGQGSFDAVIEFLDRHADVGALPDTVVHQGRRCLLDLIGVAAAGSRTELSELIHHHAKNQFAAPDAAPRARLLFSDGLAYASPLGAALANGMTIDAFDAHDGHPLTKGHAGVGVFAALAALAQISRPKMTLDEFLARLICGYEIAIRAGIALHSSTTEYHTSGAWAATGAAISGAHMLGLDRQKTHHAAGIADYHGPRSPMMRCIADPTMVKDGSGWGAMAGVSAVLLARDGFTGAPALPVESSEHVGIWNDLGTRWRILEQYFKPWPVCRWAQPAMQAAQGLMADHRFDAHQIERVEVHSFAEAVALATRQPENTEQAQYSLPFPLASLLVHGKIGPASIDKAGLKDPDVLHLSERIELIADSRFDDAFPAERWARVMVHLTDGRTLCSEPTTAHGDANRPLSDEDLVSKFNDLMEAANRKAQSEPIEKMLFENSSKHLLTNLLDLMIS